MNNPGWYLGLRHMQGAGLIARAAEKIDTGRRGVQFIFADRILCRAKNWQEVIEDWFDALASGGHLIVWLPDCRHCDLDSGDCVPRSCEAAKEETKLTLADVEHALDRRRGWQLHEAALIGGFIYAVWRKRDDEAQIRTPWRKRQKHLLIARTGAHGDALMASSILPWLKSEGWTISFISKQPGCEVLRHDPHIDELILLASDQLKENELPYYWQAWSQRFDRFINLTHSVEGELLKQPGRDDYWWPADQRRNNCGKSYLGHIHKLANVPGPYRVKFYPSKEEENWAKNTSEQFRKGTSVLGPPPLAGGDRGGVLSTVADSVLVEKTPPLAPPARGGEFILWCLRGSAVHKWWPYAPQAICQLLAKTDCNIVLTGDAEAEPLAKEIQTAIEKYHGDVSRIHNLCNKQTIREIITLAHHAVLVVGPETGVMNAVSLQLVPKILLLSHSAASNLTDDWINTTALKPTSPCYPCHRLHHNHDWCPQDKATGAAMCAASISVEQVVSAVLKIIPSPPSGGRGAKT